MQFDVLYQELERGAVMIQALVAGITAEEARFKPSPDPWSVLEVIGHLVDEERWDFRQHLDHMLQPYGQPSSPSNPPRSESAPPYNQYDFAKTLDEFVAERKRSLAWLKELSSPDWGISVVLTFGPDQEQLTFKAGDMLASWVAHDNLHMRQLVELRRARLVRLGEPYDVSYAGGW